MSILQKFLIPRHGNQSVMAGKSSLILKRGEFFIETPNNGPGTGHCKIKIGDGVTPYPTLPYAMGDTNAEVSSSLITFDTNSSAKASEALGAVVSGAQLKDMIAGFKQSISLLISAQKSFTTITDGTSSIHASSAADTLKITGGTNTTVSYDVSGKTISISSKDTTYGPASSTNAGITKLYSNTGTSVDGTMTQNAITNLVNSTKSELNSAIGAINSFEIVVLDTVDDLPATGTAHTVYFVPDDTGSGENVYDEFVWLPSTTSYEQIGVTTADLSKYYKKTDVDSKISSTKNSLVKNITYSGHTVTVTFGNGSTTSFNTADNNTTYGAGTGLSLSGNTFSINSGASTVAYAGKAGSANSAGSATNDSAGNDIHNTYIKDVTVNGRNITFTKGNGSTVGIVTQDTNTDTNTTYSAGTGLSLTGTSFSINQGASTVAYAKNSGWASSAGAATTADKIVTARNIKIGSSSKKFDGSSDVSYSLSDIGAQPSGYYTTASVIRTISNSDCTVDDIFELRKGTTGGVGSVEIKQKSSGLGSEIPTGWYNYIYLPHKTGIGGDNDRYATVILCPMTFAGESYILRYSSGSLAECRAFVLDNQLASQSSNGLMSAADKKAIDREFFRMLPKGGTYIPAKADLNTIQYLKVGNYYNSLNAETGTMKNCPSTNAFMMYVLAPLSEVYDNESTAQWVYRLRIFIDFTGHIFTQFASSDTPGNFTYGPWVKMTNSNELDAVSNTINTHIANKANPHGVTKAQVGLGNVANLDQSKAIKSITRSGTTFTATALDGTTSTFTQQDNNTTYGAGSGLALSGTTFSINQNASTVAYAKNANYSNSAGSATNDSAGHNINSTYIKDVSVNGRTVTFTKGNGSTFSILTQDTNTDTNTTYSTGTGLTLSGTTFGLSDSASTVAYAKNSGWANGAGAATNDGAGNNINTTYIKSVTASGRTVTFTKGNGSTFAITTQDTDTNTTYGAGSGLALSGTTFSINQNASTVSYAKNANWANGASYSNYIGGAGVSTNALRDNTCFDFGYEG